MEKREIKTVGILTSGGDAPGMNAAVRSATRHALLSGLNVKAIYKGYKGLMANQMQELSLRSVSGILGRGGTMIYSARSEEFNTEAGVNKAVHNLIGSKIDALIVCGGDGSFRGAKDISLHGIPCIGIPCTIDNDIACTDYTIGFDTAVNTVVENIDRLRDTSQSHERCSVVEVMGRHCGDIAIHSALCSGAVSVIIPEIEFDIEKDIISKMEKTLRTGKNHFIVIVAEGVTSAKKDNEDTMTSELIAQYIESRTGVTSRATILGHIQRGGSPSARDRVLASRMGYHAVELILGGNYNRVVAERNDSIVDFDMLEAFNMQREVNIELYNIANSISI